MNIAHNIPIEDIMDVLEELYERGVDLVTIRVDTDRDITIIPILDDPEDEEPSIKLIDLI